jgi:hypothetical protein
MGALEVARGKFRLRLAAHEQADDLALRDLADHLAVNPANGVNFVRPVGFIVRPAEPGGGVRLPFGGHGVAEFRRGRVRDEFDLRHKMCAEDSDRAGFENWKPIFNRG